jgi:tetratricopeptide (TPR) repeat protein
MELNRTCNGADTSTRGYASSERPSDMQSQRRTVRLTFAVIAACVFPLLLACASQKAPAPVANAATTFDGCIRQGMVDLSTGNIEGAIAQFGRATTLNDKAPRGFNLLGMAYFQKKDYAAAEHNFERALALDASFASAYANLGGVYFVRQNFGKARDMLAKALALNPNIVAANYSMGNVLIALGDVEGGASYLAKGIALDPNYLDAQGTLLTNVPSASFGPGAYLIYARLFAERGDVEKTAEYLTKAKQAGFRDWHRIAEEKAFEKVRDDPRIKALSTP